MAAKARVEDLLKELEQPSENVEKLTELDVLLDAIGTQLQEKGLVKDKTAEGVEILQQALHGNAEALAALAGLLEAIQFAAYDPGICDLPGANQSRKTLAQSLRARLPGNPAPPAGG